MGTEELQFTHVSNVKVDHSFLKEYLGHSHTLPTEPVAMGDSVYVAIDRPCVKEGVHDGITGEDAETRTEDATGRSLLSLNCDKIEADYVPVEVMTVRQHCLHLVSDRVVVFL